MRKPIAVVMAAGAFYGRAGTAWVALLWFATAPAVVFWPVFGLKPWLERRRIKRAYDEKVRAARAAVNLT